MINESKLNDSYIPESMIITYSSKSSGYVEHHNIENINGKYQSTGGSPLTIEIAKNIFRFLEKPEDTILTWSGLIPRNVLYHNNSYGLKLIWYKKPEVRQLQFKDETLNKKNFFIPGIIFFYDAGEIKLYCYNSLSKKETLKRPDINEKLFLAPFFNMMSSTSLCTGNYQHSEGSCLEDVMHWTERALYNTRFTHASAENATIDLMEFWKANIIINKGEYPSTHFAVPTWNLKKLNKTILQLKNHG